MQMAQGRTKVGKQQHKLTDCLQEDKGQETEEWMIAVRDSGHWTQMVGDTLADRARETGRVWETQSVCELTRGDHLPVSTVTVSPHRLTRQKRTVKTTHKPLTTQSLDSWPHNTQGCVCTQPGVTCNQQPAALMASGVASPGQSTAVYSSVDGSHDN